MLGVYVGVFGNELTLRTTFTVITLVQLLRIAIRVIPWGITLIVGSMVSLKRLGTLLWSAITVEHPHTFSLSLCPLSLRQMISLPPTNKAIFSGKLTSSMLETQHSTTRQWTGTRW